jgi:hypothetical protein
MRLTHAPGTDKLVMPDETLNYWADRFAASDVGGTLEQFLARPAPVRERMLDAASKLGDAGELHGDHEREPLAHHIGGRTRPNWRRWRT